MFQSMRNWRRYHTTPQQQKSKGPTQYGKKTRTFPPNERQPSKNLQLGKVAVQILRHFRQIRKNRTRTVQLREVAVQILGNHRQIRHWILPFHQLIKAESRFTWTRKMTQNFSKSWGTTLAIEHSRHSRVLYRLTNTHHHEHKLTLKKSFRRKSHSYLYIWLWWKQIGLDYLYTLYTLDPIWYFPENGPRWRFNIHHLS